ncbi:MAG: nicotinate-nucleotide adenylyltransferase [candidate division WOR-3 bacterium]
MKIGIFGGAFNPIHLGHLISIEEVREKLSLDKVLFIPTYKPPHKKSLIDYQHRCNMVKLAIKNNPYFELCEIEKERRGVSFTINTLKELRKKYPKDTLYLIIGSDQYAVLNTWKQAALLNQYAKIVVMIRPGWQKVKKDLTDVFFVNISQIDIASRKLREDIKNRNSIKYKVSENVYEYINKNKLYQ